MTFLPRSIFCIRSLMLLLSMLLMAPAGATTNQGFALLDVKVRVPDQSPELQSAAFASGLQQVLVRLSGDSKVLEKLDTPPAGRYVKQFRYNNIEDEIQLQPGAEPLIPMLELWIQYDEDRLVSLLRNNNIPVWFSKRDTAVVWLAVRDGMRHYLLRDDDESQLKTAMETAAAGRGVPMIWPRYDGADRASLRFADVWGGFEMPLREVSNRYANGPVIAVNMAWTSNGWVGEWYLHDAGQSRYWMVENLDYTSLIASGMDKLADELGRRYAVVDDDSRNVASLKVMFRGVSSVASYKRVQAILQEHPAVKNALLSELNGDDAVFDISLRTDKQDFLERMARNRSLRELVTPVVSVSAPPPETTVVDTGDQLQTPVAEPERRVPQHAYQLLDQTRIN